MTALWRYNPNASHALQPTTYNPTTENNSIMAAAIKKPPLFVFYMK